MSRGTGEYDALAAEAVIGVLDGIAFGAAPLLVGATRVGDAISATGVLPTVWSRRVAAGTHAMSWPRPGPYTSAIVRMPKSKDELDFLLDAAASVLPEGAPIVVYGHNEEGIRSAADHLSPFVRAVETLVTRRHCRVVAGHRREAIVGLRGSLAAWRRIASIDFGDGARPWISYPGLFARGRLDDATALLLAHLPKLPAGARVLDFATGTGVIAAALHRESADQAIDLLDSDSLAIEAARENVPNARTILGDDLASTGTTRYDLIVSNPPIHEGVTESYAVLERLIERAPAHLARSGSLTFVVQRRIEVRNAMQKAFGSVEMVARDDRFAIWRGRTV